KKGWVDSINNKEAPYDVIVSGLCIHHQPDERKLQIYREIFGLLKPGGIFLNLEHVSSSSKWLEEIFDDFFVDAVYDFNKGKYKDREEVARELLNSPERDANILAPLELQCRWLQECGFEDVDCYFNV
ncbi:MAG: methyltransferase domain-containing protein, partial [bacterium]